jgi:putative flavoprotein involved in K+ transport
MVVAALNTNSPRHPAHLLIPHASKEDTMSTPTSFPHTHLDPLEVLVIGAGQAGLAIAWHLKQASVRFLVVDAAATIGHTWRTRWDSLTLFSPSQYDGLPGMAFPAVADTYPTKDQVADYLTDYATTFDLPILLDTPVTGLTHEDGRFTARTPQGAVHARQVVVATGAFQTPVLPKVARRFDPTIAQLHSVQYRNPDQIPPGRVLVVGAGNSGLQIARELAATHQVHLAVGSRPLRVPQRILGRDLFWWLTHTGAMGAPADSRLGRRLKARGDLVIGTTHRDLRRAGVNFHPRLVDAAGTTAGFADGTSTTVDTVVWATGLRPDHSWIQIPAVRTSHGVHRQGGITAVPGLYFLGLPWQRTRGSSLLGFVQHDAACLAGTLLHHRRHLTLTGAGTDPGGSAGGTTSSIP